MIDFYLVKSFFREDEIIEDTTISVSFKKINILEEDDFVIIKKIITKFINSSFIFMAIEENVLQQLIEKLSKEEKERIWILGKHGEKKLNDYTTSS